MRFITTKSIIDTEKEEAFDIGDTVMIEFQNGGGCGGCKITKVTDLGFHYNQGAGRDKNVQYKDIADIRRISI